jgi:integrase
MLGWPRLKIMLAILAGHLSQPASAQIAGAHGSGWHGRRKAGRTALTPAEYTSPLARRVYDLRHACVSTWLNGGVAPAQVAEWAGHSVAVLLRVYAKCIDGQDQIAKRRVEGALRESDDGGDNDDAD